MTPYGGDRRGMSDRIAALQPISSDSLARNASCPVRSRAKIYTSAQPARASEKTAQMRGFFAISGHFRERSP